MDDTLKMKLNQILRYIEENIRVTDQTTIDFIDPRGHIERLSVKQNQIIFGRRGSGKSLLLKSIKEKSDISVCLTINLEDFKDISFPDSIIQVLIGILQQLKTKCVAQYSILRFWEFGRIREGRKCKKRIDDFLNKLNSRLSVPDSYDTSIRTKQTFLL